MIYTLLTSTFRPSRLTNEFRDNGTLVCSVPCLLILEITAKILAGSKDKSYSLALAVAKALWAPITATMVPRLVLIAFSIAQPFLIEDAIRFVEDGTQPNRYGYGLIGAFGVTYVGISVRLIHSSLRPRYLYWRETP
jgi:hypothetical protein